MKQIHCHIFVVAPEMLQKNPYRIVDCNNFSGALSVWDRWIASGARLPVSPTDDMDTSIFFDNNIGDSKHVLLERCGGGTEMKQMKQTEEEVADHDIRLFGALIHKTLVGTLPS